VTSLDDVLERARRLPFVELVHLLEELVPAKARVGADGPIYDEPVRFRHDPALGFHTSDITGVRRASAGGRAYIEVTTSFAGVTGSSSPLPSGIIEEIAQADDEEGVQRDLVDGFHHRLLGLLYRGLMRSDYARSFHADASDRMSARLLLLAGFAPESAERVSGLPRGLLLRLAPLLVCHPPSARRLELGLRDVFDEVLANAHVRVLSMTGGVVHLERDECPRLGVDMLLGRTSCLGRRIPAPQSGARVLIGPLSSEVCARLAPGGARHAELCAVIALLSPEAIDLDVELQPRDASVMRLGRAHGSRMGLNTWLGSRGAPAPVRFRAGAPAPDAARPYL
jgi:type VI secretion system protein ImpH